MCNKSNQCDVTFAIVRKECGYSNEDKCKKQKLTKLNWKNQFRKKKLEKNVAKKLIIKLISATLFLELHVRNVAITRIIFKKNLILA